jgi:2-dehydropantoate 2-reductase
MRFVTYGTGAIGGSLAARLTQAGHDAVAIARGGQLEAIRANGLTLHTPSGSSTTALPVVAAAAEIDWTGQETVLLTVKSQDTQAALLDLAKFAPPTIHLVCAQNGVDNERSALRQFRRVYGAVVMMPATFLRYGEVSVYGTPRLGTIDLGCYPTGTDQVAEAVASALNDAGFDSRATGDIMRWKYGKLLGNLTNAVEAVCGLGTRKGELGALITAEGIAVLEAAGVEFASEADEDRRRAGNTELDEVGGEPRLGASAWQSLQRGSTIETDYLNGEIGLLGRLHGVGTPANDLIQSLANEAARDGQAPGGLSETDILALLVSRRTA